MIALPARPAAAHPKRQQARHACRCPGGRFAARLLVCAGLLSGAAQAETCSQKAGVAEVYAEGWGIDVRNTRYQPRSAITAENVGRLGLDWVFAIDEGMRPHSWPLVTEDTVFIGSDEGNLYALDKTSGCQRWRRGLGANVRTALATGVIPTAQGERRALFFGTSEGFVHALSAESGEPLWQTDVKDHPFALVTGTPVFYLGKLYVPLSSHELGLAMNPFYGCCKFRGSVLELDAATGRIGWRSYTIAQPAEVTGSHFFFVQKWGPSGAPVWSAPTIDPRRDQLVFGTGENYTQPASPASDAIVALDRSTGVRRWVRQYTPRDTFNMACVISKKHVNCPEEPGPDLDFGAPPVLARLGSGREILLAGQKSGVVYAMEPGSGKRLWSRKLGRGGYLGGVHWGMAVNESLGLLFVPISDVPAGEPDEPAAPGLSALDIQTGEIVWNTPLDAHCEGREECWQGLSAAVLAAGDLVFAGALDGRVLVYSAVSGDVLWQFDSWKAFESVNALPTRGGAVDVHGPMVAGDRMLVQSGYGSFRQRGGNALLVFRLGEGNE